MIDTITKYSFQDAFHKMGRGGQFSYGGLDALFDYFEMLEEDTDQQIEFDVIAICCEYSEYDSLKEFQNDYGDEYESLEDIENTTTLIKIEDEEGFIIQQF
tara:strand:+ start:204 stop:506 length:303 start_codon:yes stop_codon:yes gene_type:complete